MVSPDPAVADPVFADPSKHAVTFVPEGANGKGLIVTVTSVRGPSQPVAVILAPA